jgi:hypothetical protein
MLRALTCCLLACCALAACTPEPPEKERPPEPQATLSQDAQDTAAPEDPIERARAVQEELDDADQRQREAIEESGG